MGATRSAGSERHRREGRRSRPAKGAGLAPSGAIPRAPGRGPDNGGISLHSVTNRCGRALSTKWPRRRQRFASLLAGLDHRWRTWINRLARPTSYSPLCLLPQVQPTRQYEMKHQSRCANPPVRARCATDYALPRDRKWTERLGQSCDTSGSPRMCRKHALAQSRRRADQRSVRACIEATLSTGSGMRADDISGRAG